MAQSSVVNTRMAKECVFPWTRGQFFGPCQVLGGCQSFDRMILLFSAKTYEINVIINPIYKIYKIRRLSLREFEKVAKFKEVSTEPGFKPRCVWIHSPDSEPHCWICLI